MYSVTLSQLVEQCPEKIWPTPRKNSSTGACRHGDGGADLQTAVKYPTPCASEARQGLQIRRDGKKGSQQSLSTIVKTSFPTPCEANNLLSEDDYARIAGQLNPDWVEWLMGWLIGWTSLEPLAINDGVWREINIDPADNPGDISRITTEKENRCNRLKAIGNGQVPLCKAIAIIELSGTLAVIGRK